MGGNPIFPRRILNYFPHQTSIREYDSHVLLYSCVISFSTGCFLCFYCRGFSVRLLLYRTYHFPIIFALLTLELNTLYFRTVFLIFHPEIRDDILSVQVGIAGVPADKVMKKTKTVQDSWTPVWNEEFSFPLKVPELAVVRIEIHDYDVACKDDFGGQTCLPVSSLRPGIRSISLFDSMGVKLKYVKILMRFEFC